MATVWTHHDGPWRDAWQRIWFLISGTLILLVLYVGNGVFEPMYPLPLADPNFAS